MSEEWQRIVVKVGTSSIAHPGGSIDLARMERLVRQLSDLHHAGRQVVLVSSGAIATGIGRLQQAQRKLDLADRQALAAVGQGVLMHLYEKLFAEYGLVVGQVLLTREDIEHPQRAANARATLQRLLQWRVVPIINENDTVANEEIKVGDNDTLSARVAVMAGADLLVLLSDVDGLYPADPRRQPGLAVLPLVEAITPEIMRLGGGPGSAGGTGGMRTKLEAARICLNDGVQMVIANGERPGVLQEIVHGDSVPGTLFRAREGTAPRAPASLGG